MKTFVLTICTFLVYNVVIAQLETALLKSADSLSKLKKYEAAIVVYSKILKQKPQHEKALIGRGASYLHTDKLVLAEKDYKEAIKANPACVDCHIGLGRLKFFQDDKVAALSSVTQALQLDDKNVKAWVLRARISLLEKKYSEAATNFNKAISFDSTNADAYYFRATLFAQTQLFESALKDLSTVQRLEPDFASAYYDAGAIYGNQQKWAEALKYFSLAIQKDSTNSDYYKAAGNVYFYQDKHLEAVQMYTKAIKWNDKDVDLYGYRGEAYYALEDMDASCRDFKAALTRISGTKDAQAKASITDRMAEFCDSTHAAYYYQRGIANYNLKQFANAVEWYNKGLKKFPQHFMLFSFRGNARLALGEFEKAESDYTQAFAFKNKIEEEVANSDNFQNATPEQKQAHIAISIAENYRFRADARLGLNNYAGAVMDIDEALKLLPADAPGIDAFYNTKGTIYLAQEDNNNALSWYNKAVQVSPNYSLALVNRAIVKVNLAYKTSIINTEIFGHSSRGSSFRLNLPPKNKTTVIKDNIESALADCNRAIAAEQNYAYAFYIRGIVKMILEQGDHCYDLLKSEQLGFTAAKLAIEELKCR